MSFTDYRGKFHVEWFPKQASTDFAYNSLVATGGTSGTIKPATSVTTNHVGIIKKKVASTDADYALNTLVPVVVPEVDSELLADGTSFESTDIGTKIDLTDASNANAGATSVKVLKVTGIISSTQGIVKMIKDVTSNS